MKKKVATAAIAAMTMTFLAGCSSRGTYAKYLTLGEYKGLSVTKVKTEVTDDASGRSWTGICKNL